ncbi:MAG: Chromate transport protein ChrA [Ktedonobacterales bacterium]|jgi:chromate transporter|nr:MAG: Chromate transport protein ChrA [Ktedonobacterales bacterium]
MPDSGAASQITEITPDVGHLPEVTKLFLRLGFTSLGGPAAHIAMMRQEVVVRRKWISDQRFVDLMGMANLIPGPTSTELAIYLGYLRAGWPGLIVGGICFIGPAMLIVLAFAWAYVRFGSTPQVNWLLYGIQPVVIAIIAQALFGLGKTVLRGPFAVVVAAVAVVLYLLGVPPLLVLFGLGAVFGIVKMLAAHQRSHATGGGLLAAPFATTVAASAASAAVPFSQVALFLTFLKIGAVLYGSGYVLLAFLQNDLVRQLGWLTEKQLLDAISVGQFTPGPVFTTATFIGYVVGGWLGALLATIAIFLPSFVFVAIIHQLAGPLRRTPWTRAILDGVNISALALMAGVTLQLGRYALVDPLTVALAVISFAILVRYKPNSAWLLLGGGAVGMLVNLLAGA